MNDDQELYSYAERHAQIMAEGEKIARRIITFVVILWILACLAVCVFAVNLYLKGG